MFPHQWGSPSRRDYTIVSADLLPLVSIFEVLDLDEVPVHAPLAVTFKIPGACPKKTVLHQLNAGLSDSLLAFVRDMHGIVPHVDIPPDVLLATNNIVQAQVFACFQTHAHVLHDAFVMRHVTIPAPLDLLHH